ncbi:cation-binding protein [Flexivirga endophytica]|uniref:Cation-binding protein n=1 Tax=Flexivirga endophytica TaxID=1849103 RepID=A0A916T3A7_9MICO|nr:hemerythrin domain-containing protein [Flexivirga endophytica]GGB26198.1 cation-binding protein [Flexivirga endophytica]GHB54714.1 cation-binding protein [Flexivirga endophytica]
MDITEIIQQQHDEQRRGFAMLEEWPRDDTDGLAAMWRRLAILLENHAEAEERYFYPELLKLGTGAADAPDAAEETDDAIGDHNNIRMAIRKADRAKTGTEEWWTAVTDCNVYNSRHMGEEERQDLADFRQQASLQLRHDIAIQFLRFEAINAAAGIKPIDKDPDEYVDDNQQHGGKVAAAKKSPGPTRHSKTASEDASE